MPAVISSSITPAGGPSTPSPLWQAAIDRYYDELRKGGIKKNAAIDRDLWDIRSPDDLLQQIQALVPPESQSPSAWSRMLRQFEPIILRLNDFIAIVSVAMDMDTRVAAVIWGSIRLILKFAQPALPDLVNMFEELEKTLPRLSQYERQLPMTDKLEDGLIDIYTEIIVFCAHTITAFRNNPHILRSRVAWSTFNNDFTRVISNIRNLSRNVDEIADMIRLSRENQTTETLEAIKNLKGLKISDVDLPCFMIPYGINQRFFGRSSELDALKAELDPQENSEGLKVKAIYGLGGVGKTQLTAHYANASMNSKAFDVIAWIHSETQIKLIQSLSSFAAKLGLIKGSESAEDDYKAAYKVRDWLNTTEHNFLLIFDNVEKAEDLQQIWPASTRGSIIITTRSPAVAMKRTSNVMHLECFGEDAGTEALYKLTRNQPSSDEDANAAKEICQLLGGLPLALVYISEFIHNRGCSYEEFLALYKKSAEKIIARSEAPVEYDFNLNTVWEFSFENLSPESTTLLNLLPFFDPDVIPERILTNPKAGITDDQFEFLYDDLDFGDAVIELTKASLITRLSSSKALSIHRLVQLNVFMRLPKAERVVFLDVAIRMLYFGFPNTWNKRGDQQGHGWSSWETCSAILPHVSWLMKLTEKYKLKATEQDLYAELIFRAGTYLWEKEQPTLAQSFFDFGLGLDIDRSSLICAQAYRLSGNIALDIPQPRKALASFLQALELREKLEEPDSPPIADVYDAIACAYTEMGKVNEALDYLAKATAIHEKHGSRMARTKAIYAMTYLRAQRPEDSLAALNDCWRLQNLSQAEIEKSKYPKHSGDIVLLARIKYMRSEKKEARELASRTITIRKGLFGDKGPRVADSMFIVARMLEAENEDILAAKLFREIIEMSTGMPEMKGHSARGLWFLAAVETKMGYLGEASMHREKAKEERDRIEGREAADDDTDDAFMNLVGWMLW